MPYVNCKQKKSFLSQTKPKHISEVKEKNLYQVEAELDWQISSLTIKGPIAPKLLYF